MKLKDTGLLPKKKECEYRVRQFDGGHRECGDCPNCIYNQALDECGEIEVLERLDEEKIIKALNERRYFGDTMEGVHLGEILCKKNIEAIVNVICQFGTKKIDEGKVDQLEIAGKFCLLQPCEIREDEATGRCYACKIGSSIKNAFSQSRS
ncbi:hypothetical protein LCGC14_1389240 [marine sediment metagenome]|uniref:Uncharacterized protein n=1 Tax=marine sediment metagenome TaxID=412755 RepID=A0A0F9MFY5_9ZZZZ